MSDGCGDFGASVAAAAIAQHVMMGDGSYRRAMRTDSPARAAKGAGAVRRHPAPRPTLDVRLMGRQPVHSCGTARWVSTGLALGIIIGYVLARI